MKWNSRRPNICRRKHHIVRARRYADSVDRVYCADAVRAVVNNERTDSRTVDIDGVGVIRAGRTITACAFNRRDGVTMFALFAFNLIPLVIGIVRWSSRRCTAIHAHPCVWNYAYVRI